MHRLFRLCAAVLAVVSLAATQAPVASAQDGRASGDGGKTLGFVRLATDLSRDQASACLVFSAPLDPRPEVHYGDWVKLSPAADARLRVQDRSLCFDGLSLGRRYRVTIAAGMPGRDATNVTAATETSIDFGDRPKMVEFAGQGIILAREATAGVTVNTVNVDTVALEVLRINDRLAPNLLKTLAGAGERWSLNRLVEQSARLVWSGTMQATGSRNEIVRTAFPLAQVAVPRQPGIYLLVAANAGDLKPRSRDAVYLWDRSEAWQFATQVVVQTDIAITAVQAADGLHVFTRSLATAGPLGGIDVTLQARDSQPLGSAVTDADGHAVFAPGLLRGTAAATAASVLAFGKDADFVTLDITQPAFDLSDRGVTGREVPGPLDVFVYTDRGIYRPGETIHAMALLRDRTGQAIDDGGVTLTLLKPNGVAFRQGVLAPQHAGGFRLDYDLPDTASRGVWRVEATDADGRLIGSAEAEVQDFVPQRLKVTAHGTATVLHPNDTVSLTIDGRFLYGAPASGLGAEAHMQVAIDPAPFPQSAQGFRFGVEGSAFEAKQLDLEATTSDANGHATASGKLDIQPPPNVALKASITAGLQEPGGRVTSDQVSLPIRTAPLMLGIRPRFRDAQVQEGEEAAFELIAVDPDGKPRPARLHWTLIEKRGHWDWYLDNGRWRFHRSDSETAIASGDIDAVADRPAVLSRKLDWGDYRLAVEGPDRSMSTFAFRSGWAAGGANADTPDKVEVTVELPRYKLGETARLRIVPPFAGKVRLLVARDKVFATRELDVPREGATVEVPVSADWGSGAYVLASVYRPAEGGRGHLPVRAIGLAWVGVDPGAHLLAVAMTLPPKVTPRQTINLPMTVSGGVAGEAVWLTVAAVDEGILQLTRFATPDPAKFYFGQRRLAVDIRDDYAKLMDGTAGQVGALRSGGDAFGGKGLPVVPTRSVALFQGPVAVGADGKVTVPLAIPDFEGELRVMAIAYSHSGIGKAEAPLTVRDPVVPDLALPRFLAPGDEGRMTLLLDNPDGPVGEYTVTFAVTGAARLPDNKPWRATLGRNERKLASFPIAGDSEGTATVTARLTGPGGLAITREWSIAVRGAHYPVTLETVALQPKNEGYTLDRRLLDPFIPGSVGVQVSYARLAGLNIPGLLQSLWRYPYGCTEQLASTAFPLVYYDDPTFSSGAADKQAVHRRVQDAIDRIIDRQDPEGTFGLWRAGDHLSSRWLSLYALDFLVHARAAGYEVADFVLERGYANAQGLLRGEAQDDGPQPDDQDVAAYAAWLLAPVHRVDLGQLRQQHDRLRRVRQTIAWPGTAERVTPVEPMALAQLGGALTALGDRARGVSAMRLAVEAAQQTITVATWDSYFYWSRLRDAAGILAVAAESDQLPTVRALLPRIQSLTQTPGRLSTQEKAWLLVAGHAVTGGDKAIGLTVNGAAVEGKRGQAAFSPNAGEVAAGYSVATGDEELWRTIIVHGTPKQAAPPLANGLTLRKSYFATDGARLDPAALPQNKRFIVLLEGEASDKALHHLALVDLLPAGWEIEAILRPDQAPAFVGTLTRPRLREARDDRLLMALDLGEEGYRFGSWYDTDKDDPDLAAKQGKFRAAYVVRAVTQGSFTLPEAVVEDMYHPAVMARTGSGTVRVVAP